MIAWREKFRAVSLHFMVTLAMATAAAVIIFFIWYPDPFQTMLGGSKFFILVTTCDLVLGPLTSLIVYNSKKTRRALIFDYTVIGIVQLAAFVYGVMSMANARPIYVAFVKDRFEVVMSEEIADNDLLAAQDPYRSRPKFGPLLVGTKSPTDREERNTLVLAAMEGKDVQNFPRFFVPYEANVEVIKQQARPLDVLEKNHPEVKELVAAEKLSIPRDKVRWLPVRSPKAYWTVLLDADTARVLAYVPLDPW
jgi:hypothetical protein